MKEKDPKFWSDAALYFGGCGLGVVAWLLFWAIVVCGGKI
jgi:hypothetical protein